MEQPAAYCRGLSVVLVVVCFLAAGSSAANVTLTCPRGMQDGQEVTVTCRIQGRQAHDVPCETQRRRRQENKPIVLFEFLFRGIVTTVSTSFNRTWHLLENNASLCGPEANWTNSIRCVNFRNDTESSQTGEDTDFLPSSVYEFRYKVNHWRQQGFSLRCMVGCQRSPHRYLDVSVSYDTCHPLNFLGDDEDKDPNLLHGDVKKRASLSPGALAGIIFSVLLVVGAVPVVCLLHRRWMKRQRVTNHTPNPDVCFKKGGAGSMGDNSAAQDKVSFSLSKINMSATTGAVSMPRPQRPAPTPPAATATPQRSPVRKAPAIPTRPPVGVTADPYNGQSASHM